MRDLVAAHNCSPAAPQAPARNIHPPACSASTIDTYNSHRRIKRPKLGDKKVYRPIRRNTLSRIDEAPPAVTVRPRSKSLQHSYDFSSTRVVLRSRSNTAVSADTSRSVPVCNDSHELGNQNDSQRSPQYALPERCGSSSDRSVSSVDLVPSMPPIEPIPYYPQRECYVPYYPHLDHILNRYRWKYNKKMSKHSNVYLAFMY